MVGVKDRVAKLEDAEDAWRRCRGRAHQIKLLKKDGHVIGTENLLSIFCSCSLFTALIFSSV